MHRRKSNTLLQKANNWIQTTPPSIQFFSESIGGGGLPAELRRPGPLEPPVIRALVIHPNNATDTGVNGFAGDALYQLHLQRACQ